MAGINIEISGLNKITAKFKELPKEIEAVIQKNLNEFAINTASDAKELCPVNEGHLRNSIHPEIKRLECGVTVSANYAAYVEFGTRKYAAAYVGSLPSEWQQFASQFKGRGGGSFAEMVERLTEWVRKKGLGSGFAGKIGVTGTYSTTTRKRTGSKITQDRQNRQAAYVIAKSIMINGIRPQPFLFPSVEKNRILLEQNLKAAFNA